MKKTVTIRKCKKHRYTVYLFAVLSAVIPIVFVCSLHDALVALPFFVPFLLLVGMALYYKTWQIHFGAEKIEKKVFFINLASYSYTQLKEAVKGYYYSENGCCIRMYFTDGKTMQFRLFDENATLGEKLLLKHCSVKISTHHQ